MSQDNYPLAAAGFASLFAGPLFLVSYAGAYLYLQLPAPVVIRPDEVAILATLFIPAFLIGMALALVPNIVGSLVMARFADLAMVARPPPVWAVAGGLIGAGFSRWTGLDAAEPAMAFALVATSAVSAWICRRRMRWD